MRRTAVIVSVAIAVLPLAGSATTAAGAPGAADNSAQRITTGWLAHQQRAMVSAGATPVGEDAALAAQVAQLVPAGELKGHREDVLDERTVRLASGRKALGLTARVGATGRELWRHTIAEPKDDFLFVQAARVGARGRPGVVVFGDRQTRAADGTVTMRSSITAYQGSSGARLWSRSLTGTVHGKTVTGVPELDGVLAVAGDGTPGYLLTEQTAAGHAKQSVPVVVSGVTGAATRLTAAVSSTAGYPEYGVAPDLNGDGTDDVLLLTAGGDGYTEALSGVDGAAIWTGDEVADASDFGGAQVIALPDFTSRSVPDLAVPVFDPDTEQFDFTINIVSGQTGHVLWTRPGLEVNALHATGSRLAPAVQIATFADHFQGRSVSTSVTFRAVTPGDTVLYKRQVSVSVPAGPNDSSESDDESVATLGDVQPDGWLDQQVSLSVEAGTAKKSHTTSLTGVLNGRTGAFRAVGFQTPADGSLRRGAATDLLAAHVAAGHPRISAWRGSTGERYYRRVVHQISGSQFAWSSGLRESGHACSDVGLTTVGHKSNSVSVLDARAAPLWTVTFTRHQATGGKLEHYAKPSHYCL